MRRRRAISARWLLPAALLVLLVVPAAAGAGVWFLEGQRQQDDLDGRLRQATAYIREHVSPTAKPIPGGALQRYLDRLDLRVQLTLLTRDTKSPIFVSPALVDANVQKKLAGATKEGIIRATFQPPIAKGSENLPHVTIQVTRDASKTGERSPPTSTTRRSTAPSGRCSRWLPGLLSYSPASPSRCGSPGAGS